MWINIALVVQYIIFFFRFKIIYLSSTDFCNTHAPSLILNFTKFCPVVAELFRVEGRKDGRTDGRTDRQTDGTDDAYALCLICFSNARKSGKKKEGPQEGEWPKW